MNSKIFYFSLFGFVGGIGLRSFFAIDSEFGWISIAIGIAFIFTYFCLREPRTFYFIISIFLIFFGVGIVRYNISDFNNGDSLLESLNGMRISAVGIIGDEPDVRESSQKLTVDLVSVSHGSEKREVSQKILLTVSQYAEYNYGEKISISGVLQKPENFAGTDGKEFDYISFLAKDEIFYQMFQPKISILAEDQGNFIKSALFSIKQSFIRAISSVLPEPQSSLAGGLLLGAKRSLGTDLTEDFRRAGIIHIVVLSGYNITIVAEAIMRVLSFLPYFLSLTFGGISIILFAILTGGSATVVRASVMALLALLARATGRTYQITRALFAAAFFMLIYNPKLLAFDSSFQLSFASTIGLIYFSPIVEKYLTFIPEKFQLRQLATATIATQIFVLPILLYKMGELSLVALPVNLLVLAFIPLTMLVCFIAGSIAMISSIIAMPIAFVATALLSYELGIVNFFSHLPFASLKINYFPLWLLVIFYIIYFILFFWLKSKIKTKGEITVPILDTSVPY